MTMEKKITIGNFRIKLKTFVCALVGCVCFSSLVWAANCGKMYPEDSIQDLHHKYESAGNPCAFNKCAAGDIGGCSYGSSQLACMDWSKDQSGGTMGTYLKRLQNGYPGVWEALGGGSSSSMIEAACNPSSPQHSSFLNAWKGMCSGGSLYNDFGSSQESFIKQTHYDSAVSLIMKNYGIDINQFPPEVQMSVYSASVALGAGGASKWMMRDVVKQLGNDLSDPPTPTEKLLEVMYDVRKNYYGSSSPAIRESVQNRWEREKQEALESYKIRKAWEEEQANPSEPPKTLEDIVKEVTGKEMCEEGESGSFSSDGNMGNGAESGGNGSNEEGAGKEASTGYEGKDCAPSQYANTMNFCMFCPLFKVIFNTASAIAQLSFQKLSKPVISLVLVGFAIWIAIKMLAFLSSVEKKEAPALIKELLHMSFVVGVVVILLLSTSSEIFALLMEPVFNTGFKMAQLVVGGGECKEYGVLATGGLPASMGNNILCTIEAIQDKLIDTLALGTSSMCVGFFIKAHFFIFPSLPYVFSGLLLWGGALVLMVIFPFLMLDSIFQLTVACALLPVAIGSYPFKYTKGLFVGKVWDTFINAMFNFIFLSIFIFIITTAIDLTLKESIDMSQETMDQNYVEVIVNELAWAGIALLKIVFVLLLAWALMDEVGTFAGNFSKGINTGGIGRQIGGLAGNGAKALGLKSVGGIKSAGKAIGRDVSQRVGNIRRGITERNLMQNGTATPVLDNEGKQIGTSYSQQSKSWLRGRDKVKSVTIANNGAKLFTTQKDYGDGKIKTTQQDGLIKITTTNNNGIISEKISMQAAALKSLSKKDGSINTMAWDNAVANSAFAPEKVKAALVMQYAKESMPGINPELLGSLDEAQINISVNEEGHEVISITESNKDGSSQVIRMTKGTNGRALLEMESTDSYGNRENYATDGIINRHTESQVDKNGNVLLDDEGKPQTKTEFAVSSYYSKYVNHPVNSNGNFHSSIPADQIMFDDKDMTVALKQMTNDRLKGKVHAIGGFK